MTPLELTLALAALALLAAGAGVALRAERRAAAERERRREVEARQTELLERQHAALEGIAREAAAGVSAALDASLLPALQALGATLERLSAEVEAAHREALEEIARSFKEQLAAGFREEFEALSRSLHEAAAWHEKVHRDLGHLLEAAERTSEGHLAMLRRTLHVSEAVRGNAESLSRAERSLEKTADRVQGAAATLTKALEDTTRGVTGELDRSAAELAARLEKLAQTLNEQLEQGGEQLSRRIQGMALMLQRVASDIDALSREQRARSQGGPFPRSY